MKTFEDMEKESIKQYPYSVYHEDAESEPPVFATWKEALAAQKKWNKEVPGHKAHKRKAV